MNSRRLLLDTNILLDYLIPHRPDNEAAIWLMNHIGNSDVLEGFCVASSLKDVYYILRKNVPDISVREALRSLMAILTTLPLRTADTTQALVSNEPDFEDGIIRAVAENNNINFIITRDKGAFQYSPVRSMSAKKYLELFTYPER